MLLEMIVRQCEPQEIFKALCLQIGETGQERQFALFTLKADSWTLAAKGELDSRSTEALARLVPADLSGRLLRGSSDSGAPDSATRDGAELEARKGVEFEDGWARHLYSGIGEMLGLLVCFGPAPAGRWAARVDAVCRLTTLAIEQWNLREELTWQGDHDSVTGLYTQAYFERTLTSQMQQDPAPVALLHVNLDRFRLVNDVLGRAFGSHILCLVGKRFSSRVTPDDLIGRPGGDEFMVLLRPGTPERAVATAERLLASLSSSLSAGSHQVFINASIGIACSRLDSTPQSLQREAYVALYHAKRDGNSRALCFQPSMATTPPERLEMEKCLRSAILRNEMLLYYQPQIDLATGRLVGAEALLRWSPAGVGIISPATFVPILEETGLIVEFGRWVLREACAQGKRWMDATGIPIRIGANVSAPQLTDPAFVADVRSALEDSGYPAEYFELELTESLFVGDYRLTREILRKLRDLGVSLALDDFGTGQSSLSYLQELPFQRLKIDQSFVRAINGRERCPPMIENIVKMAKGLGMESIAEGIEHSDQAHVLRAAGCNEGQGYLYSWPLAPADFMSYRTALKTQLNNT
jgi:diguanylate cyclase (GGDEF)-like protein